MIFSYDLKNRPEIPKMYIAKPNKKRIRNLNGVTKARLSAYLLSIWKIDFEIDKYVCDETGIRKKNPCYDFLSLSMEINIESLGWFRINTTPEEHNSDGRWYKSFTAYGYETTLQDIDIVGININCGTTDSVEMFEENMDAFGVPERNIQCYVKNANDDPNSSSYWKFGVLNILEHEYLSRKGWRIGNVDIEVASLRGRQFEIDNQNVYAFLTQDFASAYKCIAVFDRVNKLIDIVKYENLGEDMNIELTLRNVINDITVTDSKEKYYNYFRVSGNDPDTALIEYINYGSDKLDNIDYCIQSGMLSDSASNKYKTYKEFVESHRQEYADYSSAFLKLQEEKDVYENMVPIEEVDMLFTNISDEELAMELEHFQTILDTLEDIHTDENGNLNIEGTTDCAMYVSIRDVMIPKIQAEIEARKTGEHAEPFDYKTNWELYGTNELNSLKKSYEAQIDVLKKYDTPYEDADTSMTENAYNSQHELCEKYRQYVVEINERLDKLNALIEEIDVKIEANSAAQKGLAAKADMSHPDWGFTEEELADINMLYRESDFTDTTIEVLDTDTIDDIIQLAWQLFESAKEQIEIESHPQLSYSISLDNLFHIPIFASKINKLNIGDFCFLELDEGFKTKQRVISMQLELMNFNDMDFEIEFSDMTTVCGKADDYRFLLESYNSSEKNKISRSMAEYISNQINSSALQIFSKYYGGSAGGTLFPNGISQEDVAKLQDVLDGLIEGNLSLEQLKVKLAQIDTLEADCAFVKYLEANFLVANQAEFVELKAQFAAIDDLLAGNVSAELAHVITLTADNVNIDEAVIKEIIASQILVSDLQAGDITLSDAMKIKSENGAMIMNGETLQIMGTTSDGTQYVAIQLGYDAQNNPSLLICNENGAVMLDSSGLHEDIVPDGLIKNDMIADKSIGKEKLSFETIETDENGNIDAAKVLVNGEGVDIAFTSIRNDIDANTTAMSGVKAQVDNNTKSITNKVWESDITEKLDDYDSSTINVVRDRMTTVETDLSGVRSEVSDVETTVNSLGMRVTNAETNIEQNAQAITLRATKTEAQNYADEALDAANAYSDAQIQLSSDRIFLEVSKKVDDMGIGATQLLPGTKNMGNYALSSNVSLEEDSEGFMIGTFAAVSTLAWNKIDTTPIPYSVVRGQTVTFSLNIRSDKWEELNADASHGLSLGFILCESNSTSQMLYTQKHFYSTVLSDNWVKFSTTVTLTDDFFSSGSGTINDTTRFYIRVYNYSLYSMQVKKFKLELGNVSTDWSPAPEDTDASVSDLYNTISEQKTSIMNDSEAIILHALESYVLDSDYDEFKQTVESELKVLADNIEMNFTTTTDQINAVDGEVSDSFSELYSYIHFSADGIQLGKSDSAITLSIENDIISFKKNGVQFGWWDGVDFHTGNIVVELNERAQFGNFAFVPRTDGSLSFLKVGG